MNKTQLTQRRGICNNITAVIALLLLSILVTGMLFTVLPYAKGNIDTGFLAFKQVVVSNPLWRTAFYIHVFSSVFTLLAGLTQFDAALATRQRRGQCREAGRQGHLRRAEVILLA